MYSQIRMQSLNIQLINSPNLKTENILKPEYITTKLNREDISILLGKEPIVVQDIQESTN